MNELDEEQMNQIFNTVYKCNESLPESIVYLISHLAIGNVEYCYGCGDEIIVLNEDQDDDFTTVEYLHCFVTGVYYCCDCTDKLFVCDYCDCYAIYENKKNNSNCCNWCITTLCEQYESEKYDIFHLN